MCVCRRGHGARVDVSVLFPLILQKETPLANAAFWAARRGNLALLRLLLTSGRVDVDCRDSCGTSLLMVASYAGHIDCVRELVLQGADINLQRESGTTALFFAAQQGHNDVVRFLFEFGASTEFRTKDGGTALLAASQYGHRQVVDTLLKHGANVHDQLYDGATALFLAAQGGYLDVTRLLLSSGARVNQPRQVMSGCTGQGGGPAPGSSRNSGGSAVVREGCLDAGGRRRQNRGAVSPYSAPSGPLGSDVPSSSTRSNTIVPGPLPDSSGRQSVLRLLGRGRAGCAWSSCSARLTPSARLFPVLKDGTTALLKAANKGYHAVIQELLKFSPTLGILKNGTSALHAAVLSGNIKTVALLLEAGADPALRNKANKLPAELTQNERILSLLRGKEGHRKSYLSCIFD
ncbi:PREDICTED: ankyrin repeat domain-containing protein 29 [Myotis davidii]|uniref:ankyrin repeat domain-containing protein 29 n=1 Tax=Myotis davidii TaxID=225400 RepID=UPI00076776E2|nr:PREDICTED: ankyrin repeat domain-containing protein 29 [Myotis davidii]